MVQLEMGYTYIHDKDGGDRTTSHSYPEPLLRYGIFSNWLEFRAQQSFVSEKVNGVDESGASDLYLGFKIALTPQECLLPEMAIIPQMFVPTGSGAFTDNEFLPGLNWIYAWDINDCISTAGSTQFNRVIDDLTADEYTEWAQSWTVAYSLTDDLGAYTEWFALFPHSSDTAKPEHYFNGGFAILLSNDIQWDIRAGIGLNESADDYFVGSGISIRFH